MNRFIAFVKKEFLHIFRDYRTMLILFIMPIAQILIFGFAITTEIKDASIAILDKSKDEVTRELTQKLLSSGYFNNDAYLTSESQIEPAFNDQRVKMVVVFEPEFGRNLQKEGTANVQLVCDASDPNQARMLSQFAEGIFASYASQGVVKGIQPEVRMFYNESLEGVYMSIPGIMAMILMLVSAMMTSISITREKEYGSMEVLLISPLKPLQIIMGKVTPYVMMALINAVSILALGYFVFGVPVKGSIILLLMECLLFTILALSLGILISTVAKNQMVAMFMSMFALMLPVILLSGFIFPVENMPLPLRIISNIIPPKWFIIIVKTIMLKGGGLLYVWKETLILIGFVVLFVTLSVKKFKIRLQ
ncbi:ABC transporter permease [Carboxylicivirga linearis]|uniref:Transport permease protein n=1 Tax=Carboxylicivirga linearis TaxID=1628157 RepID=A0ABS5JZZ0_9BACT|nr:ABC transporter permease [Carboxylicivirga linearis]MBS2100462.1 ABC transporter permease [Carboxylicivirga linearis]